MLVVALLALAAVLVLRPGSEAATPPALAAVYVGAPTEIGGTPVGVAVGAGAVWVVDANRNTLTKFDAATGRRAGRPAEVAGGPFAVVVGEGAVWVAAGDGSVRAFDPSRPSVAVSSASVPGANGLAVGAGGVWVTSRRAGTLTRIDPRTGTAGRPVRVGGGPADVVVGEGAVWVADAEDGAVTPVDPENGRPGKRIRVGGGAVRAIAVGDGSVWAARAGGELVDRVEVVRIDPRRRRVVGKPIRVTGGVPLDLAAGAGSVWVNDVGLRDGLQRERAGAIARIDAARGRAAAPVAAGRQPAALALSPGALWVVGTADATLTRVALTR